MPKSDIIVLGASAGGVEAFQAVAAGLTADIHASIFMVLHIGSGINGQSQLPVILGRAGKLPAKQPTNGEAVERGIIYVAPPDCHMLLFPGEIRLSRGPKENRTRPAINPLFRSAARSYDGRVAGVLLTGFLDDGVAGLAEIKRQGGVAIVEDPLTAMYPDMPSNAQSQVSVDHVVRLEEIPKLIAELANTERTAMRKEEPLHRELAEMTCPECGGPIWRERQGSIVEFRCRIGHAYSPTAMAAEQQDAVERALWGSVVALEQAADIDDKLASELGPQSTKEAQRKRESAEAIREILNRAPETD